MKRRDRTDVGTTRHDAALIGAHGSRPGFLVSAAQVAAGMLIGTAVIYAIFFALMTMAFGYTPSAPPLLKGLHAGSYVPCPIPAGSRVMHPEPPVSELTARLRNTFKVGTHTRIVEAELASQGFSPPVPCPGFPDRRISIYRKGSRWAGVAWKVDKDEGIEDIQGSIQFDGL